jgi:hypothetical protein
MSQIDGIFIDTVSKPAKYFYDPKNPHLVDDRTIAGHPLGLKRLSEFLGRPQTKTVTTDVFTRQGILHGRVLGYDTLRNSTKAWAALLAVIDAVTPRAELLNAEAAEAHERQYAGSRDVDEWGMRLDRRGFDEAQALLHSVHLFQHGYYLREGCFAPSRETLDPTGTLLSEEIELKMELAEDGSYAAWVTTPPGAAFGLAAKDDDFNSYWLFQADGPPVGGIEEDDRWVHLLEADFPDW